MDLVTESLIDKLNLIDNSGCIIIDFDETLWLRNSTETYLATLRPRLAAVLILTALDLLRPWILLPGDRKTHIYRDWIRVLVTSLILPWSLGRWRRLAPTLAVRWKNSDLLDAVKSTGRTPLYVATFGFRTIVAPLLQHIEPAAELCAVGSLWNGYRVRQLGKKAVVEDALGKEKLAASIVITDSQDDSDLLGACRMPILMKWPAARYEPALAGIYLPFLYTQKGKRPGSNYMLFGVLLEDVVLLCLAFAWTMPSPLIGAGAILLLHLSFWSIYEIGYVENDLVSAKYENQPKVKKEAALYASRMKPKLAWIAAFILAIPGLVLLVVWDLKAIPVLHGINDKWMALAMAAGLWILYLAVTRFAFWSYNRIDIQSRSLMYVVLQILRTLGYATIFQANIVGAALLASLVLVRWMPYISYRYTGVYWEQNYQLAGLTTFLVLSGAGFAADPQGFLGLQFASALLYLAVRAQRPLRKFVRDAHVLRKVSPPAGL